MSGKPGNGFGDANSHLQHILGDLINPFNCPLGVAYHGHWIEFDFRIGLQCGNTSQNGVALAAFIIVDIAGNHRDPAGFALPRTAIMGQDNAPAQGRIHQRVADICRHRFAVYGKGAFSLGHVVPLQN